MDIDKYTNCFLSGVLVGLITSTNTSNTPSFFLQYNSSIQP